MKNKILPFSVIIIFGIIFFIFYKGLEDTKIYTPDVNTKKEIPVFNTKEFFSGENVKSSSIFELDKVYLLNIWSSWCCLLYTSPSPRDAHESRMPSSA